MIQIELVRPRPADELSVVDIGAVPGCDIRLHLDVCLSHPDKNYLDRKNDVAETRCYYFLMPTREQLPVS